jgi:hypothetical protein
VGQTRGYCKSGYTYEFHGKAKSVWLYPLEKNFRAHLCKQTQAEPEAKETKTMAMTLDVEALPLAGAGGLFDVLATIVDPRKKRVYVTRCRGFWRYAYVEHLQEPRVLRRLASGR